MNTKPSRRRRQSGRTLVETMVATAGLVTLTSGVFSLIVESQRSLGVHLSASSERSESLDGFSLLRRSVEQADPATLQISSGADHALQYQVVLGVQGTQAIRGARLPSGVKLPDHQVWIGVTETEGGERQLVERILDPEGLPMGPARVLHAELGPAGREPGLEVRWAEDRCLELVLRDRTEGGTNCVRRSLVSLRNADRSDDS